MTGREETTGASGGGASGNGADPLKAARNVEDGLKRAADLAGDLVFGSVLQAYTKARAEVMGEIKFDPAAVTEVRQLHAMGERVRSDVMSSYGQG